MRKINRCIRYCLILMVFGSSVLCSAQEKNEASQSQYLFTTFQTGIVQMKSGALYESIMNYNCLTEEMIFIQDGRRLALASLETVDTVYLNERVFVPVGEAFFELLVDGDADLFIQHKSKASIEGEEVGYGGTSQLSNVKTVSSLRDEGGFFYMDMPENISVKRDPVLWVREKSEMVIVYNKRTVLKTFPDLESSLKSYFKSNKVDFESSQDLTNLVDYINSLRKN